MSSSTSVRLKPHEQTYLNQTDNPLSHIVRQAFNDIITNTAEGICPSCGQVKFNTSETPTTTESVDKSGLKDRVCSDSIASDAWTTACESCIHQFHDIPVPTDTDATIEHTRLPATIYQKSTTEYQNLKQNPHHSLGDQATEDAELLWGVESFALQTAGGKPWDFIIPATMQQFNTQLTDTEFTELSYVRGLGMLLMLETVLKQEKSLYTEAWFNDALNTVITWLADLEKDLTIATDDIPGELVAGSETPVEQVRNIISNKRPKGEGNTHRSWTATPWSKDNTESLTWTYDYLHDVEPTAHVGPATAVSVLSKHTDKPTAEYYFEKASSETPTSYLTDSGISMTGNIMIHEADILLPDVAETMYLDAKETWNHDAENEFIDDFGVSHSGTVLTVGDGVTVTGVIQRADVFYAPYCPHGDCTKLVESDNTTGSDHCPIHGSVKYDQEKTGFTVEFVVDTNDKEVVVEISETALVEDLFNITVSDANRVAKENMSRTPVTDALEAALVNNTIQCTGLWTGDRIIYQDLIQGSSEITDDALSSELESVRDSFH